MGTSGNSLWYQMIQRHLVAKRQNIMVKATQRHKINQRVKASCYSLRSRVKWICRWENTVVQCNIKRLRKMHWNQQYSEQIRYWITLHSIHNVYRFASRWSCWIYLPLRHYTRANPISSESQRWRQLFALYSEHTCIWKWLVWHGMRVRAWIKNFTYHTIKTNGTKGPQICRKHL